MKNCLSGIFVVILLTACSDGTQELVETKIRPVRTITVSNDETLRTRTFSGVSRSTQESRMSFKIGGTVVDLPVQVGVALKSGDLIASLNPSSYDLQVEQADATLAASLANQRNSDANYKRVKGLYANTNASRNDLDVARASAESAQAQVRSSKKSLEIAELNRSYTRLRVAADCTVATLDVDINENINAGEQIAKVNCGAGIEIIVGIPASLIAEISPGMAAKVRFNSVSNKSFDGTVTEIGIAAGGGAATFPVTVVLGELDRSVRPSMAAEVAFEFDGHGSNAHSVPAAAVVRDEHGTFVFVAKPSANNQATIERRAVETGELTSNGIEIVSGLLNGDRVVTAGTSVVREGLTVLLQQ